MTREELAQFDGKDGRKAYGAVNGKIYDFTGSKLWENGDHQSLHSAGTDLTEELRGAPHVRAVVERFPVVGNLEEPATQASGGAGKMGFVVMGAIVVAIVVYFILR